MAMDDLGGIRMSRVKCWGNYLKFMGKLQVDFYEILISLSGGFAFPL